MEDFTTTYGNSAAQALPADRAAFIRKTYLLLAIAVFAFIAVEAFFFTTGIAQIVASLIFSGGSIGWLAVLGLFMGISYLANRWAVSDTSAVVQYMGLGVFVIAEAVVFIPLLFIAAYASGDSSVILKAGVVSLGLFAGLTFTVLVTRTDFSWLAPILGIGGFAALGFIIASAIFGFSLGNVFAFIMVAFAGTSILYQTSNVLHRFNTNQHVAAALTLFASVALLFWYILSIFSSRR
ncbi:MAG: Bax inhibitor-1 family protein [Pyrinomonadaceae bacterium]